MLRAHILKSRTESQEPSAKEVGCYLRELLDQSAFEASERNRRFLTYVVQETLEGRADRIKAYNIALAAFDRTDDFDPVTDPIVRIEASRLRRSLEHYYLTGGKVDRIRIEIPKGSYAAAFSYMSEAPAHPQPESAPDTGARIVLPRLSTTRQENWRRLTASLFVLALVLGVIATYSATNDGRPTVRAGAILDHPSMVIVPFEDTGGDPTRSFVARSLTYDVATVLTQLDQVAIFGSEPALGNGSMRSELVADFALTGSIQIEQHNMRVTALLMDAQTGQFLQSWSFQKNLIARDLMSVQAEVAQQILVSVKGKCTRVASNPHGEGPPEPLFDCRRSPSRPPSND